MNIADASTTRTDVHGDRNGTKTTAKAMEVNKTPMMPKPPNSPVGTKIWRIGEADGSWNRADGTTIRTDVQSVEMDRKQLKMRAEMSVNGRGGPGRKTHLVSSRSKH